MVTAVTVSASVYVMDTGPDTGGFFADSDWIPDWDLTPGYTFCVWAWCGVVLGEDVLAGWLYLFEFLSGA